MVHVNNVLNGIAKYMDRDLYSKMSGVQRWLFGSGSGLLLSGLPNKIDALKKIPLVSFMNVIDDADMVDIDRVYQELMKHARVAPAVIDLSQIFNLPILPSITLDHTDVEKIYRYIQDG
jgi:hypothetical protein